MLGILPPNGPQKMSNADYLLAWPNVASTSTPWTLSHRDASGEVEPLVASTAAATSTSAFYTIIPSLSSDGTSSYTAVTFLRLLTIPSTYPSNSTRLSLSRSMTSFIYASCSVNPQSTAETATLKQYDQVRSDLQCFCKAYADVR